MPPFVPLLYQNIYNLNSNGFGNDLTSYFLIPNVTKLVIDVDQLTIHLR